MLFAMASYGQKKLDASIPTKQLVNNPAEGNDFKIPPGKKVQLVAPASQCLETYLTFCNTLYDTHTMQLQNCAAIFQYDPDGWIECNQFSSDLYLAMHAVADAAYDRCMGVQPVN